MRNKTIEDLTDAINETNVDHLENSQFLQPGVVHIIEPLYLDGFRAAIERLKEFHKEIKEARKTDG